VASATDELGARSVEQPAPRAMGGLVSELEELRALLD
jgi:hypothetical protein